MIIKTHHIHDIEKGFLVEGELITFESNLSFDDGHKDVIHAWLEDNISSLWSVYWGVSIVTLADAKRKSPFRVQFRNDVDATLFYLTFKSTRD